MGVQVCTLGLGHLGNMKYMDAKLAQRYLPSGGLTRQGQGVYLYLLNGCAGDLLPEEYSAIVDMHARRRLNLLMDIMCRMELLRGLLISENSHISRIERSVYIVRPDVSFEEPRRVSEPGFVSRFFPLRAPRSNACGLFVLLRTSIDESIHRVEY